MLCFEQDNFLSQELLDWCQQGKIKQDYRASKKFIDKHGVWKGQHTITQNWLNKDSEFVKQIQKLFDGIDYIHGHAIDDIQILDSYKAHDIHSDWVVWDDQTPTYDVKQYPPSYTVIVPLVSGDFHTVVFDQEAEYNSFSDYKKINQPLETHCSDDDWQTYLNHCHAEDQKYLTIKKIFKWQQCSVFGFHRKLFHSSSHHSVPKKAILAWLSYPTNHSH